jgi:hypothetical protein
MSFFKKVGNEIGRIGGQAAGGILGLGSFLGIGGTPQAPAQPELDPRSAPDPAASREAGRRRRRARSGGIASFMSAPGAPSQAPGLLGR